jgi:hypothetical protein
VKNQQTWDRKLRRNKLEIRLKDFFHELKEAKKEMRHLNKIPMSLKSKKRKRKKSND